MSARLHTLTLGLLATACQSTPNSEGSSESAGETNGTPQLVTYHADIRPLIERKCLGCHVQGAIAPLQLTSWDEVQPFATQIVESVSGRIMPPWMPDEQCRATRDARGLSDDELALVQQWQQDGYLEGDAADYVAPAPPPDPMLGEPDLVITMPEVYTPSGTDDYRCIPISAPFDRDVFITAVDVSPGNAQLVHHALVYVVGENALTELDEADAAVPGPGYTCFGGPGVSIPDLVGIWAPGISEPLRTPDGTALRIPKGSRMILQMHYNTLAAAPGADDQSAVQLWTLAQGQTPAQVLNFVLFSNKTFEIPAGEPAYVVETELGVPASGTLVGIAPHMHTLGTSMSAEHVESGECLIDVPRWDFSWQNMFYFDESAWLDLEYGDTLRTVCNYDNSAENQPIIDGQPKPPSVVGYGETTFDEMCIFYALMAMPFSPGAEGMCGPADACVAGCGPDDIGCFMTCIKTAGTACFACALQHISACAPQFCVDEIVPLLNCITLECPTESDTCLPLQCEASFQTAWDCLAPHVYAGECDADLAACGLTLGP